MNRTLNTQSVFIAGAILLTAACGADGNGDDDSPLVDSGMMADAAPDAGPARPWPVPSDFPPDGPMQPGEGDACRLSVQCTDHRQICVDDACIREERVRAEDLTLGDWRTLTPESTDENPFAEIVYVAGAEVVLDEDGEVGIAGSARDSAGRTVFLSMGQDLRFVRPVEEDVSFLLPYLDGFLTFSRSPSGVAFVGADGTRQWTATPRTTGLPPYESGIVGYFRPMVHTPSGPALVTIAALNTTDVHDIINMQRLDLDDHRFEDVDFVHGPYLTGAGIGQPIMGPSGLELVLGRSIGEGSPTLTAYSVATGEERPLGIASLSWDAEVTPLAADEWVAVAHEYSTDFVCDVVAVLSAGDEVARIPDPDGRLCPGRYRSPPAGYLTPQGLRYLNSATRSAWVRNGDDSLDGVTWFPSGWGAVRLPLPASRYRKTFEIMGLSPDLGATPGVYMAERQLRSGGGGL